MQGVAQAAAEEVLGCMRLRGGRRISLYERDASLEQRKLNLQM